MSRYNDINRLIRAMMVAVVAVKCLLAPTIDFKSKEADWQCGI